AGADSRPRRRRPVLRDRHVHRRDEGRVHAHAAGAPAADRRRLRAVGRLRLGLPRAICAGRPCRGLLDRGGVDVRPARRHGLQPHHSRELGRVLVTDDHEGTSRADRPEVWGLDFWGWAAVFIAAILAAALANALDLVPDRAALWLQLAPLVLVPPMANAQLKLAGKHGVSSTALTRYNRNMLIAFGVFL